MPNYEQHFIEWFSGKQIPSYWTTSQGSGSGGYATMTDVVDGGLEVSSGTGSNNNFYILFSNSKTPFIHTGCTQIAVWKDIVSSTPKNVGCGFSATGGTGNNSCFFKAAPSIGSVFQCATRQTSSTHTGSSVTLDTEYHTFKMDLKSASIDYYIEDVLEVTRTTQLPIASLSPLAYGDDSASPSAKMRIKYMECFNT